jgi:hypothetical protein
MIETSQNILIEHEAPKYIYQQLGRFALSASAIRLEQDLNMQDGQYEFNKEALQYARADIRTRLLEAVASRHLFKHRQIYNPSSQHLEAFGVSVTEMAKRWMISYDIAHIPYARHRAEAEVQEAMLLDSIAREAHSTGRVPEFNIATISTYAHEIDNATARDLHFRPDIKLAKLRTFAFEFDFDQDGERHLRVNASELMVEGSDLETFRKLALKYGAIVGEHATSVDLLRTQLIVDQGITAVDLGRDYDVLLQEKYAGKRFKYGKNIEDDSDDPAWEDVDSIAEPFVEADLEFAKQLAISLADRKATRAVTSFVNGLIAHGNLSDRDIYKLTSLQSINGLIVNNEIAELLTEQHLIKIMSELACVLGTEKAYEFFGKKGVDEVRKIVRDRQSVADLHDTRLINIIGSSDANFDFCGGGVARSQSEPGGVFSQTSDEVAESLFGGSDSMKCVTCPFCKKTVDAIVTKDEIECPSCNKVVNKQSGKLSTSTKEQKKKTRDPKTHTKNKIQLAKTNKVSQA